MEKRHIYSSGHRGRGKKEQSQVERLASGKQETGSGGLERRGTPVQRGGGAATKGAREVS